MSCKERIDLFSEINRAVPLNGVINTEISGLISGVNMETAFASHVTSQVLSLNSLIELEDLADG